jgi:hypothetical protein
MSYNSIVGHPNPELPLCGEGSTSQTSHDVVTMASPFVTNIGHIRLSMFFTKQHHLIKGARFGKDLGQLIWSILDGHAKVFHMQVWAKDFLIPCQVYFGN